MERKILLVVLLPHLADLLLTQSSRDGIQIKSPLAILKKHTQEKLLSGDLLLSTLVS